MASQGLLSSLDRSGWVIQATLVRCSFLSMWIRIPENLVKLMYPDGSALNGVFLGCCYLALQSFPDFLDFLKF